MDERPLQRNLVLILARNFASQLATAVFLVDEEGTVIYYNEAAERVLGHRFIEGHGMRAEDWYAMFRPRGDGRALAFDEMPLGAAITRHEPAHGVVEIAGADGVERRIEVAAFPLFAHVNDFVGAMAIFWELGA
jgi:PAS domain-containing protein